MQDQMNATSVPQRRVPWNKGKLTGAKPPVCAKGGSRSALFDHLVDLRKRRCRHSETERFGSFEIEDQRYFAGCWTGQSSGRLPCFHCMKPSARTFPVARLAVPTPQICRSLTQA
jgi:hypothetical protein